MSSRRLSLALALALGACDCADPPPVAWWVGDAGAARVLAVSTDGGLSVAAGAPAIDAPARALLPLGAGAVLVLQDVDGGAGPGVLLSRSGERLASLASRDGAGALLFDPAARPWAAAEARDGRIWVTGRRAPVIYAADGAFAGAAPELPFQTRGIAALPDGRVLVTYGVHDAAVYAAGGGSFELLAVDLAAGFVSPDPYSGLDALAARADGSVVVAALRWGTSTQGVLVHARVEAGRLVAVDDPELSARLPALPSSIALAEDEAVAGPSLGTLASPACARRLSPDLRTAQGCLAEGSHRGVARLR